MRALITGINGFAGGFLAEHLLAVGDEVFGCTRSGQWLGHLPAAPRSAAAVPLHRWAIGEPTSTETIRQVLAEVRPECVYHLAAISVPAQCGDQAPTPLAREINVGGVEQLADAMREIVPHARLIFTSSSHVYGSVTAEAPVCDESTPLSPRSAYGQTKAQAEEALRTRVGDLDFVVARSFQHTGPGQQPPYMIPRWLYQLLNPDVPTINVFTLHVSVDISDVRDAVRAYRFLAERGVRGEVYNVASGRAVPGQALLEMMSRIAGVDKPCHEEFPESRPKNVIADCRKLQAATGWRPEFPLETTLRDMIEHIRRGG